MTSPEPQLVNHGLPVVEAPNPVVSATALARERGALLAIGPRASEEAVHASLRRARQLALDPKGSLAADDPSIERLRAMAKDVSRVRRVLAQTIDEERRAGRSTAASPPSNRGRSTRLATSTRSAGLVIIWVALLSSSVLLGAAAALLGAEPWAATIPLAVALVLGAAWSLSRRRTQSRRAVGDRLRTRGDDPVSAGGSAAPAAAVRAASAVVRVHDDRWAQAWSDLDRPPPEPSEIESALAELAGAGCDPAAGPSDALIDLREPAVPLVVVEPFSGLGPHRAMVLHHLLSELDRRSLVAVVVSDAASLPYC